MIEQVKRIVREASNLMKTDSLEVSQKDGAVNIVTNADVAVQHYLQEHLSTLIEGAGFVGEEEGQQDWNHEWFWVVDPIDGTTNFARDLNASGISVGLVHNNEVVLGVVYCPYVDEMFWAEKGKGAFCNGKPIHVSDTPFDQSIYCTAFCCYNKDLAPICENIMHDVYEHAIDFRRFGSACVELCKMAQGSMDLYFEIRVFPWDFAGSEIIIKEAGGAVGSIGFDRSVFYRPIPYLVANSEENLQKLKAIVQRHLTLPLPYDN